ncbi:MAG: molybdopterin-dependent oxidoreductase [Proteobacteria bacterium]|nr:molybdopterin-dependent oxidoreductase [Pseudomonadota bacterium]MBU1452551.1 molybdopterin-dependent oxidoreductase [Pseudomonadota bacterium]MBU2469513.1 molybdopterin-dependent oxidoreductase [Pseudomonadota bacterium]MBU2517118.1 molybdopterin-dependent oxidoreductase [Pseudomonadota bacterium]
MKKIDLTVNGRKHEFEVGDQTVLLDVLREDLDLIGAKQSCDRKGQCGACMVLVDGKAVRSCLAKAVKLDGSEVITVEGLGTPDNPHLIQEAFVLAGAVQCGFCTPGMIMAAKGLLDQNPDPGVEEIKKALRHNLCRCTGYKKIVEAVRLAGSFLRGEKKPEDLYPEPDAPMLGVSHPRPSAMIKACGVARFCADYKIKDALELAVVRSPLAHAKIKSIDTSEAEKMPGVAGVVTAKDVKGTNILKYIKSDRPVLCGDKVRYIGDPIVAVAADTRERALAAAEAVKVELEPLPVLENIGQAMAEGVVQVHDDIPNMCYEQPIVKGDADAAFAGSAAVVEAEFQTQINHQAPLEPEVTVAYWERDDDEDKLVIVGRSINIHLHLGMLQEALGHENMRYEEAFVGGQFGIKIDVITEGIAGAAAIHFKRPVRYVPSLAESMLASSKRHAFNMKVRMGADENGMITAYANDLVVDNGAYYSIGHVVVLRALWMLAGSYNVPALDVKGRLVYTNNPWGSAARGAGPPQQNFALESAVDMLARKMGQDPLEFRYKNFLQVGQSGSTGQAVEQWPIPALMDAMRPHYQRAVEEAKANQGATIKRGVGLACGSFGIGGPGDASVVAVELDDDGGVSIFAAAADPGEGNDSMLTQIACEVMGLGMDKVRLNTRSTDVTAASGPAAGSRITYMMGNALIDGLRQIKELMAETGAKTGKELEAAGKPRRCLGRKKNIEATPMDPVTGQGPNFETQVHAVQMAELEVNTETGEVKVIKMTTAVDAGTVIHPQNLAGQLEGGMDMGVGYALREEYVAGETSDWRNFKFPTMATSFDMEVVVLETPRDTGPLGATGVGEMCMVPTAPAVLNAIDDAIGVRITTLPATPEKVKAALAGAGA